MADTDSKAEGAEALPERDSSRRKFLTPEQRRFLGTPRAISSQRREETSEASQAFTSPPPASESHTPRLPESSAELLAPDSGAPAPERNRSFPIREQTKASRRLEMQHAIIILGILITLVGIFWAGRKFDHVKGFIMSRVNPNELEAGPERFPGLTSGELVENGLALEREGDWEGAAQRFLEAKRKDLRYEGILFHLGKGNYDRKNWEGADRALEQALKFGENIAVANQLRGLIAVRRRDLPAAERFFEAAARAEPFLADFFYLWGDTLRLNQRPRDAIRRYQQGVQRSRSAQDATLCRFKIRLARIEAAEASAISGEVDEMRKAGPLSLDWLMTDAALQLHAGKIKEAATLISEARSAHGSNLFIAYAGDAYFLKASETHPEIASVALVTPPPK